MQAYIQAVGISNFKNTKIAAKYTILNKHQRIPIIHSANFFDRRFVNQHIVLSRWYGIHAFSSTATFPDATACSSFESKASFNLLNEIFSDDNIMRPYEFSAHTFLPSDKQYFIKRGYKKGGVSDAGV